MKDSSEVKSVRLLSIYVRLLPGQVLSKSALALEYGVTERSIQRDIESLRCFLAEELPSQQIEFDREKKGYRLVDTVSNCLTNSEILAVCKILLESRSMLKSEMEPILNKLIDCAVTKDEKEDVRKLIRNELYHYIQPHHEKSILRGLWEIGQAVRNCKMMEILYRRMNETTSIRRKIKPVGIMFSEYYFYLTAFTEEQDQPEKSEAQNSLYPRIYRIDRIKSFRVLKESFKIPYRDRFQEGEFRKRVQFMYGGELETVRFRYTGPSVEAVLDRLPTAEVIQEDKDGCTISAEVFGTGIDMWLRSQGDYIQDIRKFKGGAGF